MKKTPETPEVPSAETEECPPHFWVIPLADGGDSRGTCRKCKAEKTFTNHLPIQSETHRGGRRPKRAADGLEEDPTEDPAYEPPRDGAKPGSPWRQLNLGRKSI